MTGYKRPHLLLEDPDRLVAMARRQPFQVVFAGKAHPRDDGGKELIARLYKEIQRLGGAVPMAFPRATTSRWLASWCPVPMYG